MTFKLLNLYLHDLKSCLSKSRGDPVPVLASHWLRQCNWIRRDTGHNFLAISNSQWCPPTHRWFSHHDTLRLS